MTLTIGTGPFGKEAGDFNFTSTTTTRRPTDVRTRAESSVGQLTRAHGCATTVFRSVAEVACVLRLASRDFTSASPPASAPTRRPRAS